MKLEQTECSETSAYKIKTPGNYPEESIQHRIFFSLVLSKDTEKNDYKSFRPFCSHFGHISERLFIIAESTGCLFL